MAIKHSTGIEWTDDESDEGAGYEEMTGVIHVPRHHLKTKDAEWFAAAIGHEVRHAWQWDVIEGRITPPGGAAHRAISSNRLTMRMTPRIASSTRTTNSSKTQTIGRRTSSRDFAKPICVLVRDVRARRRN